MSRGGATSGLAGEHRLQQLRLQLEWPESVHRCQFPRIGWTSRLEQFSIFRARSHRSRSHPSERNDGHWGWFLRSQRRHSGRQTGALAEVWTTGRIGKHQEIVGATSRESQRGFLRRACGVADIEISFCRYHGRRAQSLESRQLTASRGVGAVNDARATGIIFLPASTQRRAFFRQLSWG